MTSVLASASEGDTAILGLEECEVQGEHLIVRRVMIHLNQYSIGDLVTKREQLKTELAQVEELIAKHAANGK